jgi:DNA-binding response OmpR family regulator
VSAPSAILVADNETLRRELALYLSQDGFIVRGVDCGDDLDEALAMQRADILILDLNLPEEDGIRNLAPQLEAPWHDGVQGRAQRMHRVRQRQ